MVQAFTFPYLGCLEPPLSQHAGTERDAETQFSAIPISCVLAVSQWTIDHKGHAQDMGYHLKQSLWSWKDTSPSRINWSGVERSGEDCGLAHAFARANFGY